MLIPAVVVSYTISYRPSYLETSVDVPPTSKLDGKASGKPSARFRPRFYATDSPDYWGWVFLVPAGQGVSDNATSGSR
jgi:hypothetical protein